jgi:hypothetical protein
MGLNNMNSILIFINAILLSGIAAYYSVIGLTSIFPGSFYPIIVMGSILEVSKLITISWLYRNWKIAPILIRIYLISACMILMTITSMGIFGYLSKAHLEHSSGTAPMVEKLSIIDEKIKSLKLDMEDKRKSIKQLDDAVDQIMTRTTSETGADKAVAIRKSQQKERQRILAEITSNQKQISVLNDERAPIASEMRKVESDFGPIKYVAELVYGSGDQDIIDKAVRLVIILIMVVFDPLAVLLLICANISFKEQANEKSRIQDESNSELLPVQETSNSKIEEAPVEVETRTETLQSGSSSKDIENRNDNSIEVEKENIAVIEEKVTVHLSEGSYEEHLPIKKIEPVYNYQDEFAFSKKEK